MTLNVVNESLTARADAYLDLEEDVNIVFRQSRLAKVMLNNIFDEVCGLCKTAEEHGIKPSLSTLLHLKRDLSALDDAIIAVDNGAERIEQRYYATPS